MKRLTALLLALLLVVGLAACGTPGAPESPDPTDTTPVEPSPSPENSDPVDEPPVVELVGTMSQVVTVNLLGNDIPVDLVRNFETGAFRIDYQFNTNDVFAEGFVLEDGTWEITDTNNDFTFGTIEAVIPVIDDSAWVTADSELVVVVPSDDPEPTTDPEPSDDPAPVDPTAEYVAQTVTVDMMGNATEVYVVKTGNHFEMSYTAMGNDVVLTGSINGDTWTFETSNVEAVAAFAGNIVNSVASAIDESAWVDVSVGTEPVVVEVEMMGNMVPVTVILGDGVFEFTYQFNGNDVVVKGTIAEDGTWNATEYNIDFAIMVVPTVQEAMNKQK